ncbi:hypothetical protein K501DRAFT_267908 [Backusella circina FSU 941]|nr:hypothetical protein K501DRAFT_267908 [Backusella circina FSU 941]
MSYKVVSTTGIFFRPIMIHKNIAIGSLEAQNLGLPTYVIKQGGKWKEHLTHLEITMVKIMISRKRISIPLFFRKSLSTAKRGRRSSNLMYVPSGQANYFVV